MRIAPDAAKPSAGLADLPRAELVSLLDLAAGLKDAKHEHREEQLLKGKNIGVLVEEEFTQTRAAFTVASTEQGAHVTLIDPPASGLGTCEAVKDTARVLGRMFDALEYSGSDDAIAAELTRWAGVPVVNALVDAWHPIQIVAHLVTFEEHIAKPLDEITVCYLGDIHDDSAGSYLIEGARLGMDVRVAGPKQLWPDEQVVNLTRRIAATTGARITVTDDLARAAVGADVLLTGVWLLPANSAARRARLDLLRPYEISAQTMALTGNAEVKVMHCLPARALGAAAVADDCSGPAMLGITPDVLDSPACLVSEAAENCLHTIKAVLISTLVD